MHFNIEHDDQKSIAFWVAPDRPDATPSVRVVLAENREVIVKAKQLREHVRDVGVHDTGICGFLLDDSNVPGISMSRKLAIYEVSTGLLLYRRAMPAQPVEGRLFRLESRILARTRLDALLQQPFHLGYTLVEEHSGETIRSLIDIPYTSSLYISGRVPFARVRDQLRLRGFRTALLLGDPFREIFARLLLIQEPGQNVALAATMAPPAVLARAREALKTVPASVEGFARALETLDTATLHYLSDPLTRQIIDAEPGSALPRDSAQQVMATLAEFDALGVESDPAEFIELVWAVLGFPYKANGSLGSGPDTALSEQLRSHAAFRKLARFDGVVFDTVCQAIEALPEPEEAESQAPMLRLSAGKKGGSTASARRKQGSI